MHVIGLLGGVASGKTEVARHLARLGAGVLDADRAGHEVLLLPEVESAVRARWGDAAFDAAGRICRQSLAKIIFDDTPEAIRDRTYLEALTHPRIAERLQTEARRLESAGCPAVVLDAPLLIEAGWQTLCDTLVFVDTPRPLRLARAQTRGWTAEDFAAREGAQESLDWKREQADVIIVNSGRPEATYEQVERLWRTLVG
jgi:dephospho-CoA kinase